MTREWEGIFFLAVSASTFCTELTQYKLKILTCDYWDFFFFFATRLLWRTCLLHAWGKQGCHLDVFKDTVFTGPNDLQKDKTQFWFINRTTLFDSLALGGAQHQILHGPCHNLSAAPSWRRCQVDLSRCFFTLTSLWYQLSLSTCVRAVILIAVAGRLLAKPCFLCWVWPLTRPRFHDLVVDQSKRAAR